MRNNRKAIRHLTFTPARSDNYVGSDRGTGVITVAVTDPAEPDRRIMLELNAADAHLLGHRLVAHADIVEWRAGQ